MGSIVPMLLGGYNSMVVKKIKFFSLFSAILLFSSLSTIDHVRTLNMTIDTHEGAIGPVTNEFLINVSKCSAVY
jgi:hypothetical protein